MDLCRLQQRLRLFRLLALAALFVLLFAFGGSEQGQQDRSVSGSLLLYVSAFTVTVKVPTTWLNLAPATAASNIIYCLYSNIQPPDAVPNPPLAPPGSEMVPDGGDWFHLALPSDINSASFQFSNPATAHTIGPVAGRVNFTYSANVWIDLTLTNTAVYSSDPRLVNGSGQIFPQPVGCINLQFSGDLTNGFGPNYTIETCAMTAWMNKNSLFGLTGNGNCFTGDNEGLVAPYVNSSSHCLTPCALRPSEMCGGSGNNSTYANVFTSFSSCGMGYHPSKYADLDELYISFDSALSLPSRSFVNSSFSLSMWLALDSGSIGVYHGTGDFINWGATTNYEYRYHYDEVACAAAGSGINAGFLNDREFRFGFCENGQLAQGTTYSLPSNNTGNFLGQWHYWVLTYNVSSKTRTIYLDGTQMAQDKAVAPLAALPQQTLSISQFTISRMDEFRVYARALPASEVSAMYSQQQFSTVGLLIYIPFDDATTASSAPVHSFVSGVPSSTVSFGCRECANYVAESACASLCEDTPAMTWSNSACFDINECLSSPCDPLTNCTNTLGSFRCSPCPPLYTGNGLTGCLLCGNSKVEGNEQCDDGSAGSARCSPNCQLIPQVSMVPTSWAQLAITALPLPNPSASCCAQPIDYALQMSIAPWSSAIIEYLNASNVLMWPSLQPLLQPIIRNVPGGGSYLSLLVYQQSGFVWPSLSFINASVSVTATPLFPAPPFAPAISVTASSPLPCGCDVTNNPTGTPLIVSIQQGVGSYLDLFRMVVLPQSKCHNLIFVSVPDATDRTLTRVLTQQIDTSSLQLGSVCTTCKGSVPASSSAQSASSYCGQSSQCTGNTACAFPAGVCLPSGSASWGAYKEASYSCPWGYDLSQTVGVACQIGQCDYSTNSDGTLIPTGDFPLSTQFQADQFSVATYGPGVAISICSWARDSVSGDTTNKLCMPWATQFIAYVTGRVTPQGTQVQVDNVNLTLSFYFPNGTFSGLTYHTSTGVHESEYKVRVETGSFRVSSLLVRVTASKVELNGFTHVFSWGYAENSFTCSANSCPQDSGCCEKVVDAFSTVTVNLFDISAITISGAVVVSTKGLTGIFETDFSCGSEGSVVQATVYQGGVAQSTVYTSAPISTGDGSYTLVVSYGETVLLTVLPPSNLSSSVNRTYSYQTPGYVPVLGWSDPTVTPFQALQSLNAVNFWDSTLEFLDLALYGGNPECGIKFTDAVVSVTVALCPTKAMLTLNGHTNWLQIGSAPILLPSTRLLVSWDQTILDCTAPFWINSVPSTQCIDLQTTARKTFPSQEFDLRRGYESFSWSYYTDPTVVISGGDTIPLNVIAMFGPGLVSATGAVVGFYQLALSQTMQLTFTLAELYGNQQASDPKVCTNVTAAVAVVDYVSNAQSFCANTPGACSTMLPTQQLSTSRYGVQYTVAASQFSLVSNPPGLPSSTGELVFPPPYSVYLTYYVQKNGGVLNFNAANYIFFVVTGKFPVTDGTGVQQTVSLPQYPPYLVLYDPPGGNSFASLQGDLTFSASYSKDLSLSSQTYLEAGGGAEWSTELSTCEGLGAEACELIFSFDTSVMVLASVNFHEGSDGQFSSSVSFTTSVSIQTSSDPAIINGGGDVFLLPNNVALFFDSKTVFLQQQNYSLKVPGQFGNLQRQIVSAVPFMADGGSVWVPVPTQSGLAVMTRLDITNAISDLQYKRDNLNNSASTMRTIDGALQNYQQILSSAADRVSSAQPYQQYVQRLAGSAFDGPLQQPVSGAGVSSALNNPNSAPLISQLPALARLDSSDAFANSNNFRIYGGSSALTQTWQINPGSASSKGTVGYYEVGEETDLDVSAAAEVKVVQKASVTDQTQTSTQTSTSAAITLQYTLGDPTPGDQFEVGVFIDKAYGTPIFKTLSGISSCPHEANTNFAYIFQLTPPPSSVLSNMDPSVPAMLQLVATASSFGPISPTLSLTRVDGFTATDLRVVVNGHTLGSSTAGPYTFSLPYAIAPATSSATLQVELVKGPSRSMWSYDVTFNLALFCESNYQYIYGNGTDGASAQQSSVTVEVDFQQECIANDILGLSSDPAATFVVNSNGVISTASQDDKYIPLALLNKDAPSRQWSDVYCGSAGNSCGGTKVLQDVRIESKPDSASDADWKDISQVTQSGDGVQVNTFSFASYANTDQFGKGYLDQLWWDVGLLKPGLYDVRAVSLCASSSVNNPKVASVSSPVYKVLVDLSSPDIFGLPQPASGLYFPGDPISLQFTEDLECSNLIITAFAGLQHYTMAGFQQDNSTTPIAIVSRCVGDTIKFAFKDPSDLVNYEGYTVTITASGMMDAAWNSAVWPSYTVTFQIGSQLAPQEVILENVLMCCAVGATFNAFGISPIAQATTNSLVNLTNILLAQTYSNGVIPQVTSQRFRVRQAVPVNASLDQTSTTLAFQLLIRNADLTYPPQSATTIANLLIYAFNSNLPLALQIPLLNVRYASTAFLATSVGQGQEHHLHLQQHPQQQQQQQQQLMQQDSETSQSLLDPRRGRHHSFGNLVDSDPIIRFGVTSASSAMDAAESPQLDLAIRPATNFAASLATADGHWVLQQELRDKVMSIGQQYQAAQRARTAPMHREG